MDAAVHPLDATTALNGSPGAWTAAIDPTWWIFDIPHGGATTALLVGAAELLVPARAVRTVTAALLRPLMSSDGSPAHVSASTVNETKSLSVVEVKAVVEGKLAATASVMLSTVRDSTQRRDFSQLPEVQGIEGLVDLGTMPAEFVPRFIREHIEVLPFGFMPFAGGDTPELTAWMRLRQPRPFDARLVTVLLDTLPSAISATVVGVKVAPTVEYSLALDHTAIAAVVPGEWILCRARNWAAGEGWGFEDAELWTASGALLGKGRQFRRIPF